jgi:hypothetical protein
VRDPRSHRLMVSTAADGIPGAPCVSKGACETRT